MLVTPQNHAAAAALREMKRGGAKRIAIWGAGDHTRKILGTLYDLDLDVVCLLDDSPERIGRRILGWRVRSPEELATAADVDAVLISSRDEENIERMWGRRSLFEERGIRVYRLPAIRNEVISDLKLPPVLAISIPKAGTWLLGRMLMLAGFESYRGTDSTLKADPFQLDRVLSYVPTGQMLGVHDPRVINEHSLGPLAEGPCKAVFIYRDPRDVVVSLAHYCKRDTHLLAGTLGPLSVRETIGRLIEGYGTLTEGVNTLFMNYRHVFDCPFIHSLRFEDLIGKQGGGSDERQRETIGRLLRHLGWGGDLEQTVSHVAEGLFGDTATFRKGSIGQWREEFGPEETALFKSKAERCLEVYGYERHADW